MRLKMNRNFNHRLFRSTQSGLLLLLSLTPMTALTVTRGVDSNTDASLTQPTNETQQTTATDASEVPPIPVVEKSAITIVSTDNATPALQASASQEHTASTTTQASEPPQLPTEQVANADTRVSESQEPATQAATTTPDTQTTSEPSTQPNKSDSVLVPNGTAIQSQLLPLGQASDTPWASYATVGFLILGMAATGLLIVKLRQGKNFGTAKSERQMQIISSLALSPKRQILLVKIRDKEVALASTEAGISLLTEIDSPFRSAPHMIEDGGNEVPRPKKVQQKLIKEESSKMIAASAEANIDESAMARSEMLMGALKNLREKSMRGKGSSVSESFKTPENEVRKEPTQRPQSQDPIGHLKTSTKAETTLRQTRAAFPKYLANAFEKEANRAPSQQQSDEAGNVTNMIRERLKELRPLA